MKPEPPNNRSERAAGSAGSDRRRKRLRPTGGYRSLASFQTATLIYDATYWFCEKFLDSRSRLVDQMVMAARSGRQNIAEGNRFGGTSSQTELRLIGAARSSLEELLLDFEDYLRHRHLSQWAPDSPEARAVREVPQRWRTQRKPTDPPDLTDLTDHQRWALYSPWLEHEDPAVRANAIICLIHQANYLLDQQIAALEQAFVEEGGYSEQLATERLARRQTQARGNPADRSDPSDQSVQQPQPPRCPRCGALMALRTAKTGAHAGQQFWGCTAYPECKGTVEL
ncbi:MAG: four helix bundle protein [Verrucomicrobia bacterium]|nr:MAG: four helix bundle protein [Verrucomicrobiota bacterium]